MHVPLIFRKLQGCKVNEWLKKKSLPLCQKKNTMEENRNLEGSEHPNEPVLLCIALAYGGWIVPVVERVGSLQRLCHVTVKDQSCVHELTGRL